MAAAAELQDQLVSLRAKQRLLQEALSTGLHGEQQRVQRALLRETAGEVALAERAVRAVDAGWDPFEPSTAWTWGYVEDPRFLGGRTLLVSVLAALPLAGFAAWLLFARWELLPALLGTLLLVLGLPIAIHGVLGRIAQERDRRWIAEEGSDIRLFNAPMPAHAALAYRRAHECDLFDTFVVHSPRAEDLRVVSASDAPSLGLLDPVLAGRIGRHSFLIAQWDLGQDLAPLT